tara:strand:- start:2232 stop:3332 length:1101 start_codon:yes stop_codon:yes gene_type:complete
LFKGAKINKTSLYNSHLKLNAKMVSFAGYDMPITYKKISEEYNAVREHCGLFDVSHMGQIHISGPDSIKFIQKITINDINKISNYEAQYSAMCNLDGGLLDDLIIFRFSKINFIIISNASNTNKVLDWMHLYCKGFNVSIQTMNTTHSLIALQGPNSRDILNEISNNLIDIPFYHLAQTKLMNQSVVLSRTGYTGELGFEILAEHHIIKKLWEYFINQGVCPAGLAVRDVLRMEMKYCLYGNDITESTNPLEAGLSWIVNFQKGDFLGQKALLDVKVKSCDKQLIGFVMSEQAIPRKGYKIYVDNKHIGEVTSGTHSPRLSKGLGLGYINSNYNKINNTISIEIRGRLVEAKITQTPFIRKTSIHN